ncbi:MAG: hypothetical protein IPM59_00885 [Chloracidobacterium sp.]|nr:hypothetical protein [Chloracidobacterium sp.]
MAIAYLTHMISSGAGRMNWSVSFRRGEDPYGASITLEIPEPVLILELEGSIPKSEFVKPDLSVCGCQLAEESLLSAYRRYGSAPSVEMVAQRSLLIYRVPGASNETELVASAEEIAGESFRYHYVKRPGA